MLLNEDYTAILVFASSLPYCCLQLFLEGSPFGDDGSFCSCGYSGVESEEAGDYTMFASVATDNSTASFTLSVDDKSVAEVPVSGSSWDDFVKVKANVTLPAGEHILRFTVTGDWFDIDYMNFAKGKDAKDPEESSGDSTIAIHKGIRMDVASVATFDVFDLTGKKVASFTARSMLEAKKLWRENAQAKSVQGFSLIRNRSNGAVARVRSVR